MRKIKIIRSIIIVTMVVAISSGSLLAYSYFKKPKMIEPVFAMDSLIEKAKKGELKETITASGNVYLEDEHEVYAEGEKNKVKKFLVEEGNTIAAGQTLVEYDIQDTKEELEKNIKETQTSLENEELNLKSITVPKTESEILTLKSGITQAEKSLYDAQTNLSSTETKITQQQQTIENAQKDIDKAQKDIDKAQKDIDKAQKTIDDNKALLDVGAITQSAYDDSVDAYDDSVEAYNNSLDSYDKSVETYNNEVVSMEELEKNKISAEYSIKTAQNSLSEAENKLKVAENVFSDESTVIKYKQQENQIKLTKLKLEDYQKQLNDLIYLTKSTVSGMVTEISVNEGTYTEENTVLLKIADFNKLIVKASIAEYDAPNVKLGQKVEMTSDGLEGKTYIGTITKVNPSASSAETMMGSETVVPVEISVDNPDGVLKPGYTLDLEIITLDKSDIVTVSASAIQKDKTQDKYYVYKIDENKNLKKTFVETGIIGEVNVEISSGLNEGDSIIKSPTTDMKDGMSLTDIEQNSASTNSNKQSTNQGGNESDKNREFSQMLPSGNSGSSRPSGSNSQGR